MKIESIRLIDLYRHGFLNMSQSDIENTLLLKSIMQGLPIGIISVTKTLIGQSINVIDGIKRLSLIKAYLFDDGYRYNVRSMSLHYEPNVSICLESMPVNYLMNTFEFLDFIDAVGLKNNSTSEGKEMLETLHYVSKILIDYELQLFYADEKQGAAIKVSSNNNFKHLNKCQYKKQKY